VRALEGMPGTAQTLPSSERKQQSSMCRPLQQLPVGSRSTGRPLRSAAWDLAPHSSLTMAALFEHLRVPCQDGTTVVAIDHLPEDVAGVVQFLESEGVPLSYWWDLSRAYLAQGRTSQYLALLQSALDDELLQAVEDYFKKRPTFEIVQLTCGVAVYHIEQYRQEQDKAAKQQHLNDATQRIAAAKKEGPNEQLPYLAAGCLALAKVCPCYVVSFATGSGREAASAAAIALVSWWVKLHRPSQQRHHEQQKRGHPLTARTTATNKPKPHRQGDAAAAMVEFRGAAARKHNGRANASGQLGQAALHFNAGRYGEALEM
jgi:hypothetical protein